MQITPPLLIVCVCVGFIAHSLRLNVKTGGRKCWIEQKEGGYGIKIPVFVSGTCNEQTNCNYYALRDDLTALFIKIPPTSIEKDRSPREAASVETDGSPREAKSGEIEQSPPEAAPKYGRCVCKLKELPAEDDGSDKPVLPMLKDDILIEYQFTPSVECTHKECWYKYNQLLFLHSGNRARQRNLVGSADHWKLECKEGVASYDGVKTQRQLAELASSTHEDDIAMGEEEHARLNLGQLKEGILPPFSITDNSSLVSDTPRSDVNMPLRDARPEQFAEVLDTQVSAHVVTEKNLSVVYDMPRSDVSIALRDALPEKLAEDIDTQVPAHDVVKQVCLAQRAVLPEKFAESLGTQVSAHDVVTEFCVSVRNSILMLARVELDITQMFAIVQEFSFICEDMQERGQASARQQQKAYKCAKSIVASAMPITFLLLGNVYSLVAFKLASLLKHLPESIMAELVETSKLQASASTELRFLCDMLSKAWNDFVAFQTRDAKGQALNALMNAWNRDAPIMTAFNAASKQNDVRGQVSEGLKSLQQTIANPIQEGWKAWMGYENSTALFKLAQSMFPTLQKMKDNVHESRAKLEDMIGNNTVGGYIRQ